MSWNYRVMRHKTKTGEYLSLHKMHYTDKNKVSLWTCGDGEIPSENVDELIKSLEMMLSDARKSRDKILDYDMEPEEAEGAEDDKNPKT